MDAISSVLCQDFRRDKFEIIVVKNFHDPDIDAFTEKNGIISIVSKEQTLGSKVAIALETARGEIICFLEDDDMFTENKLSVVSGNFELDRGLFYLHNSFETIDESGSRVDRVPYFMKLPVRDQTIDMKTDIRNSMATVYKYGLHFNLSSISIRKSAAIPDRLRTANIIDVLLFYMAVAVSSRIISLSERLTFYRVHLSDSKSIGVGLDTFIEKKIAFHRKLCETLSRAAFLVKGSLVEEYILGDLEEQRLIIDILLDNINRRELFTHILSCIKYSAILSDGKRLYMLQLSLIGFLRLLPLKVSGLLAYYYSKLS